MRRTWEIHSLRGALIWPGRPERRVALHRRDTDDLISEELRRLEPDEVYAETLRMLAGGTIR